MNRRGLLILSGATAAVVIAAVIAVSQSQRDQRPMEKPVAAFPQLAGKSAAAAKIAIVAAKSKVTLIHDNTQAWHVEELGGYKAKPDLVRKLMLDLASLELVDKRSGKPEAQDAMGLKAPEQGGTGVAITVSDSAGTALAALTQGKVKDFATAGEMGSLYVHLPGQDTAWFARSNLNASADPMAWVARQFLEIPRNRIASATVRPGAHDAIEAVRKDAETPDFTVANLPKGAQLSSPAAANGFAGAISYLSFESVKSKSSGTDMAGAQNVVYRTFDGLVVTLEVKKDKDATNVAVSATTDPTRKPSDEIKKEAETLDKDLSPWIFTFPATKADDLVPTLDSLLKKPEPPAAKTAAKPAR